MNRPVVFDYRPDRPKAASGARVPRGGPETGLSGRSRVEPSRATVEPEPPDGTSREQFLKAQLKAAYRGAGSTPINDAEESVTGRCLHPRFTWHLEALQWVREPYLTRRQVQIVELIYRDDRTIYEVGRRLGIGHSMVALDRHDALQTLIRIAWHDPAYMLPFRVYTRRHDDLPS